MTTDSVAETVVEGSLRRLVSILLIPIAICLAFLPLIIVLAFDIWAPAAINHETFGVHYVPYLALRRSYYFVRNAHFFDLLFAYLPSYLVHTIFAGYSEFDKFQIFCLLVYTINGLLLSFVCWVALKSSLSIREKILILSVAFGYLFLSARLINLMTINYHMLEAVLYVTLAYYCMVWLAGWQTENLWRASWLGALAAVAVGTKLTNLIVMAPFFLLLAVPWRGCFRAKLSALGVFLGSFCASVVILLAVFVMFHFDYVPKLLGDVVELNTNPHWLDQRVPYLGYALSRWFNPESRVFGFQVVVAVWISVLGGLVGLSARKPRREVWLFLGLSGSSGAFLGWLLWVRMAPNTVLDIILFLTFEIAVMGTIYLRDFKLDWVVTGVVGVLVLTAGAQISLYWSPSRYISALRVTSETSRRLHRILDAHANLPVAYYRPGATPSGSQEVMQRDGVPQPQGQLRSARRCSGSS